MKSIQLRYSLLIALGSALLFVPFLGVVHLFDWDEINFAECAREMLITHDYFSIKINFLPFWEKPPLFIWMQALSMNIFGVNEFAARLPNAVCGITTLVILFNIGAKLYDVKFGLLWVLAYSGSLLPHFYFKSGIIDPWFNLFIFSGIYFFILFTNNNYKSKHQRRNYYFLFISAFFIGLGMLTKGPVAALVFSLCFIVYWFIIRFKSFISIKQILFYVCICSAIGGLWFLILLLTNHSAIITEFFDYQIRLFNTQDSGHGGIFFYHWIVLLIGCFPLSIFALRAFPKNSFDTPFQRHFKLWMNILFWVVLLLFSIVKTKIVHYSSLCYFPLSFLGTYSLYKILNKQLTWKTTTSILLLIIGSLVGFAMALIPIIDKYKQKIIDAKIIDDEFAIENLKAYVHWSGYEIFIGLFFIATIIVCVFLIQKKRLMNATLVLFIASLFTINIASLIIAPQIEQYSQGAAIEFYYYLRNKNVYVETLGFKSYAYLFYTKKQAPTNENSTNINWLLRGRIDKPTYFICKVNDAEEIQKTYSELKEIYRKNGFVFYFRKVKM